MASAPKKVIVVIAAGPLIGTATAAHFASEGFTHVALLSRNVGRLTEAASFIAPTAKANGNANVIVKTYAGDVTRTENLLGALKQIEADFGAPEVVLYNAAVIRYARIGEVTEEELVADLRVSTIGLYTTAKWAYPLMVANVKSKSSNYKPTFLVTGGGPYKNPQPGSISLSLNKAAQFNLAMNLSKIYAPEGVRTGVMVANKTVTTEEKYHNPKHIASLFWDMYAKEEGKWEEVFDMGYD